MTVAKFLLDMDCDVNTINASGNTPLHVACLNGMDMVVNELLVYGANINITNYKKQVCINVKQRSNHQCSANAARRYLKAVHLFHGMSMTCIV